MKKYQILSNAAMLSSFGTFANETGIRQSLVSNHLRYYSPTTGKRTRKASSTAPLRSTLCRILQERFPGIRRIKVTDTGRFFTARAWMHSGRIVHRTAYSLPNLFGLLCEGVDLIQLAS